LTVSIFGGTTDSVALGFKSLGHETWFYSQKLRPPRRPFCLQTSRPAKQG
jgi:hypothetical protein